MTTTRTGSFTIGFRRMGFAWQKDLAALCDWAKGQGFGAIDVGADVAAVRAVASAGLRLGSVDLPGWKDLISPDAGKRKDAAAKAGAFAKDAVAAAGGAGLNFFVVMLPEDPAKPRSENFGFMVDGYTQLMPALEQVNSRVVIEGWPGPGALCCTPETVRAFFKEVPSKAAGFNFDPSHLIRMGICPHRFLREFGARVGHVHGKDTQPLRDRQYDLGHEQPPTFAKNPGWGGNTWRYTIPGHGTFDWPTGLKQLADAGYAGCVSVELEDLNFNGTEPGEKAGLTHALHFLAGC